MQVNLLFCFVRVSKPKTQELDAIDRWIDRQITFIAKIHVFVYRTSLQLQYSWNKDDKISSTYKICLPSLNLYKLLSIFFIKFSLSIFSFIVFFNDVLLFTWSAAHQATSREGQLRYRLYTTFIQGPCTVPYSGSTLNI